jgi:hypothetical protein
VHRRVLVFFLAPVKVPFAKIRSSIARLREHVRDRLAPRIQLVLVAGNAPVRVDTREQGTSERAAKRVPRDGVDEIGPVCGKIIDIERVHVRIAIATKGLRPVLVAEYPDHVFPVIHEYGPLAVW